MYKPILYDEVLRACVVGFVYAVMGVKKCRKLSRFQLLKQQPAQQLKP